MPGVGIGVLPSRRRLNSISFAFSQESEDHLSFAVYDLLQNTASAWGSVSNRDRLGK